MSVRDHIEFRMLSFEEQAAVRMWIALGLPVEHRAQTHLHMWFRNIAVDHPRPGLCYRLEPQPSATTSCSSS